ncbi:MAG TPA: hypothetical protein PKY59_11405 [Pyrinomonadaceae bacterium]|nr:hypothetical protein [Pyrinomonadaceae bacterium]
MAILKAGGVLATILAILALVITLLKQVIAFIGFLTMAFKVLIVLAFVVVIAGVGFLVFRGFQNSKKNKS